MIRLKHIYKSYPLGDTTVDVLQDVSLHIRPREFVSILGPSGSGKSTLMNIIGCLDVPDSGDYLLDGEYVDDCTEDQLSEIPGQEDRLYLPAVQPAAGAHRLRERGDAPALPPPHRRPAPGAGGGHPGPSGPL